MSKSRNFQRAEETILAWLKLSGHIRIFYGRHVAASLFGGFLEWWYPKTDGL